MKAIKTTTFVILSALILLAVLSSNAYGITGNSTDDLTPYVGVVALFSDADRTTPIGYCTGFLISPTVMLTAGHSCIGVAAVSVCFDQGPISYPTSAPVYNGKPYAYPEYIQSLITAKPNGNKVFQSSDIGIIVLDEPVTGIPYATLPQAGFVDSLPQKTSLTAIGYGVQYQLTPKNNGPQNAWIGDVSRNSAQINLLSTNSHTSDKYIRCSANPSQGKGGIAFGDSGGPVIYNTGNQNQGIAVAINAYVTNENCAGVTYHTRIDTAPILGWIKGYLSP